MSKISGSSGLNRGNFKTTGAASILLASGRETAPGPIVAQANAAEAAAWQAGMLAAPVGVRDKKQEKI